LLENTHRSLAKRIGAELALSEKQTNLLISGSINPDAWVNFPHHFGKNAEILSTIISARKQFLSNDDKCYAELGNALHYIEDRWALRPRIADKHTEWEVKIDKHPYLMIVTLEKKLNVYLKAKLLFMKSY